MIPRPYGLLKLVTQEISTISTVLLFIYRNKYPPPICEFLLLGIYLLHPPWSTWFLLSVSMFRDRGWSRGSQVVEIQGYGKLKGVINIYVH